MKVIIICVNYNTYHELDGYLLSISNAAKEVKGLVEVTVAVADNTPAELRKSFSVDYPHVIVLPYILERNDGYLGSAEVVMSDLRKSGRLAEYDYCVVSNVDLQLSKNFFQELHSTQIDENIGWIAPEIYTQQLNRYENPFMTSRPSLKKMNYWITLYKYPILFFIQSKLAKLAARKSTSTTQSTIYAGHGSIMIFSKSFITHYAEGNFPSFMYGEEIYFAELVLQNGLMARYQPNIVVYNRGGVSTNLLGVKRKAKMNYDSLTALKKRFFE
ncbi:MAG: hypothetical protein SNG49_07595 [Rikenellaceae bacterium]